MCVGSQNGERTNRFPVAGVAALIEFECPGGAERDRELSAGQGVHRFREKIEFSVDLVGYSFACVFANVLDGLSSVVHLAYVGDETGRRGFQPHAGERFIVQVVGVSENV